MVLEAGACNFRCDFEVMLRRDARFHSCISWGEIEYPPVGQQCQPISSHFAARGCLPHLQSDLGAAGALVPLRNICP